MTATDSFPVPDYARLLRLDGRRFIVAGAGYGMGRQVAHALSAQGATVVCADVDGERAEQVATQVGGISWCGDITQRDAVDDLVASTDAGGGVDGLVDIVGMAEWCPAIEIDEAAWERQLDINLRHAVHLGQAAAPAIIARGGGTMVFVASASGLDAAPNHAAYGVAKAGLMSWVRTLAVELGPSGIRANCVVPGAVHTPRLEGVLSSEQVETTSQRAPLRRLGEPDDVASATLFLSTRLSSYVTGHALVVDGGIDALFPYKGL